MLNSLLQLASPTSSLALCCGCSVPPSDSLQQIEPVGLCDAVSANKGLETLCSVEDSTESISSVAVEQWYNSDEPPQA